MAEPLLPSLNAVRSFAAAARSLSFTVAARELGVTQGAVSRMVRGLEEELGVQLFYRVGRTLELTLAGAAYYPHVAEALERIAIATRSVLNLNDGNILVINVLATFALRWLVPRLRRFRDENPDLLFDVTTHDGRIDFTADRVDVAITYGLGDWPESEPTILMPEEMGVFCAPTLIRRGPPVRRPADLTRYCLLHNSTRMDAWPQYLLDCGVHASSERVVVFEHFFMVVEAAVAGIGMALLPLYLAREEVGSGRLIQPLPQLFRPSEAYYLMHARGRGTIRKIARFKRWLLKEIESSTTSTP